MRLFIELAGAALAVAGVYFAFHLLFAALLAASVVAFYFSYVWDFSDVKLPRKVPDRATKQVRK